MERVVEHEWLGSDDIAWQVRDSVLIWNENLRIDAIYRRYDAVVHLVTAAIGAEKFYTTENNTAR